MMADDAGLSRYFGLQDEVVLLTGATGGIGRAMADAFAAAGARLVLSSDQSDACHAMASGFDRAGRRAVALPCDVRDRAALRRVVADANDAFGRIDILLANAGISAHSGPLAEADEERWRAAFDVNFAPRGGADIAYRAADGGPQTRRDRADLEHRGFAR